MRFSEKELISLIKRRLAKSAPSEGIIVGPGDDAAIIAPTPGEALVISTDAVVEDVHFRLEWATGFLLGSKSLLSSISDIFAMGARPQACLVSLGLSSRIDPLFVEDLFEGMLKGAGRLGASIVGGNITRSDKVFIDMTVTGLVAPGAAITRAGAEVGDAIYVTGCLGGAALAAECLFGGRMDKGALIKVESFLRDDMAEPQGDDAAQIALLSRFFAPPIRAQESLTLAAARICTSMIDISDGIGSDLREVCCESEVGAEIEIDSIPVFDRVPGSAAIKESDMLELAISGGEDYELLFTVRQADELRLHRLFRTNDLCRITKIGRITPSSAGLVFLDKNGRQSGGFTGFDHFRKKEEGR
ncbi:MAG TPA: thiamine-phosphate kinase [bacterium]|nr:thiamine-phosphate kinase [bacterium]